MKRKLIAATIVISLFFNYLLITEKIMKERSPKLHGAYPGVTNIYSKEYDQLNAEFDADNQTFRFSILDSYNITTYKFGTFKNTVDNIYELNFEDGTTTYIELKYNNRFFMQYKDGIHIFKHYKYNY